MRDSFISCPFKWPIGKSIGVNKRSFEEMKGDSLEEL